MSENCWKVRKGQVSRSSAESLAGKETKNKKRKTGSTQRSAGGLCSTN